MKKILFLLVAVLALRAAGRAATRNAQAASLLWMLIAATANAGTANTPKSRSTEQRLANLIPVVFPNTGGTITGNVTVQGSHTVTGSVQAGGNMTVSGNHTVGGALSVQATSSFANDLNIGNQVNANNFAASGAASSHGFTSHGNVAADSDVNAGGNVNATGNVYCSQAWVSGVRIAPHQSAGGWPLASSQAWGPSVVSVLNQLVGALNSSGITQT
jgi:cytoskeletal protein CcmA (bactofilin family)